MKKNNIGTAPQTDREFMDYLDEQIHIYAKENNLTLAEAAERLARECKKEDTAL